jgi:hypothetical protein
MDPELARGIAANARTNFFASSALAHARFRGYKHDSFPARRIADRRSRLVAIAVFWGKTSPSL